MRCCASGCNACRTRSRAKTENGASPVHASLEGLPPLFVQACENEVFLDDARTLARNAEQAGVRTELHIGPGLFHTWQIYASALEEARQAIDDVAKFVASVVY